MSTKEKAVPSVQGADKSNYRPREKWDKKIEFVLSCIGFSVGLGNVWRFPYLCYKNGGGAFLVPYFICLIAGGVPVFFLEVGLGQFMSQGGISAWNICPLFKGIGLGTTIICFFLNVYYIVILAWTLHYFFASFTSELPWASCDNYWNTENCFGFKHDGVQMSTTLRPDTNGTVTKDAVVEYWENRVLGLSKGVDEIGTVRWELALTLLLAWILVYFCVWKGIKSSGKVVYFTATFPYVMLTVLLVRGVTLPGAVTGIIYYLNPDFSKLLHSQVWIDAGTQIFFSYAIALGCMTALGSYNKFHNNFVKDCIFVCCCNSATSLYAGFAIFSVLGFMAHEQDLPIETVAESGPGLAFIAYPKAVTQMALAPFWSGLFFFMILILGLDSQFVGVEGFVTAIVDMYPDVLRVGKKRELFIAIVAGISYLIGLTMITNGGIYVFQLFDYYASSGMVLLWFCFFESVVIAWVYGAERFYDDIEAMIGYRVGPWLKICWKYLTPIITMGILIFSILAFEPLTYNKVYLYPAWAQGLGSILALVSMVTIPGFFLWKIIKTPGTFKERCKLAIEPNFESQELEAKEYLGMQMNGLA